MKFYTMSLQNSSETITYLVNNIEHSEDGVRIYLKHPLCPEILIAVDAESEEILDNTNLQTTGKSNIQRQLDYLKKYEKYLDYEEIAQLDSLCAYFVIKRTLTSRLKAVASNLGGKIASISFNGDMLIAVKIINENRALLDSYNQIWVENFKNHIEGGEPVVTKGKRAAIFNIAGFILSQLENV